MHVISLISRPGGLEPAVVSNLQAAMGAVGEAVWLSPDEAVEFPVDAVPTNLDEIRTALADFKVDVNCLKGDSRKKTLLIADMDSTMIGQECIDELADEGGVGDQVADITARAMNGELDFEAALIERVALLKGLPASMIDYVIDSRITLSSGGKTLVATMTANGARAALVSGGFEQFASRIGDQLGFHETRANTLSIENGRLTGHVQRPILGRAAKADTLQELSPDPTLAIAVGDGANDLGMLERAGIGVALHAKPSVAAVAPVRIDHADLSALLFLQGYTRDEFVIA